MYPYNRAPLLKEIAEALSNIRNITIPNIKLRFNPMEHLFYITPISQYIELIPMPYRNEISSNIINLFKQEFLKHKDDLMDCRGVTYINKCFTRFEFPLQDNQVQSMFVSYPKHNYNFDINDCCS